MNDNMLQCQVKDCSQRHSYKYFTCVSCGAQQVYQPDEHGPQGMSKGAALKAGWTRSGEGNKDWRCPTCSTAERTA